MMENKSRSLLSAGTLVLLAILFVALSILSSVFLKGLRFDLTEITCIRSVTEPAIFSGTWMNR